MLSAAKKINKSSPNEFIPPNQNHKNCPIGYSRSIQVLHIHIDKKRERNCYPDSTKQMYTLRPSHRSAYPPVYLEGGQS